MLNRLTDALGVTVLGIATVFAGLVILIVFISILARVTSKTSKKKTDSGAKSVKSASADVPDDVMAAITAAIAAYDSAPSPDVVAAIAAALNMVMGEGRYVVKHIKRINNAPAWNRAGREEQVYSRF